jgi:pyruvate/2-oxoglutarate dehydrogenase complex dihydrolipoamide acyltransferase (E2) component
MAFKTRSPGKALNRSKALQVKAPIKPGAGFSSKPPSPAEQRKAQQKALQKATLRALEKARKDAAERGVDLSEWENAFLDSVGERVRTYGRAFADPDKGAAGTTLSVRQGVKLKEIRKKTAATKPKP